MKTILVFVATFLFIANGVDVLAQEQTAKPEYKEGDAWQYKVSEKDFAASSSEALNGNYELTIVQGKIKVFFLGSNKEEVNVARNEPGEDLLLLLGGTEERPELKFPLAVGQKWTYRYQITPRGARQSQTRSGEIAVAGVEQVTTAAGSFKAFKLVKSESWSKGAKQGGTSGNSSTYFYSPDTKSVVKSSFVNDAGGTREIELVKFTPAR